jgi:signal peptidase I
LGAAIAIAVAGAALLRTSVAQINRVISVSMLPTLVVGDRLIVDKLAYGLKVPFSCHRIGAKLPGRGDVIVFPGVEGENPGKPMVKRVLGLPGDYIAFQLGHVIVNNWIVPTCDAGPFAGVMGRLTVRGRLAVEFIEDNAYLTVTTPGGPSFPGYRVLPDEVFVIGDDRGISSDSRVWNAGHGGGVRVDNVEGRVWRILAGGGPDGRIDLRHLLSPLALQIREPNVDLHKSEAFIAECLRNPPASTRPPASGM